MVWIGFKGFKVFKVDLKKGGRFCASPSRWEIGLKSFHPYLLHSYSIMKTNIIKVTTIIANQSMGVDPNAMKNFRVYYEV